MMETVKYTSTDMNTIKHTFISSSAGVFSSKNISPKVSSAFATHSADK